MTLPLTGITVVALEQAVAAPFATRQLSDLGARVIKVEREGVGDFARHYDKSVNGMSSYFVWLNRGKESVTLDIKSDADREILDNMLSSADVFVQNLAPGAMARLGLTDDALRNKYPSLILCSISGYGETGPYRDKKAYDLLVQCEAGLLSVTGVPEQPVKVGVSIADISAGMYAFAGVLRALYQREKMGTGLAVRVSMLESLGEWMSQPYLYSEYGGRPPERMGARHATIAPYGPYSAADGGQVFIGVQNEREWEQLCAKVLFNPELAGDPRFADNVSRHDNDEALRLIIEQALATTPADEAMRLLDEARIANARMRTMSEFAAHPQLAARDRWRDVDTPAGPVRCLLPPTAATANDAAMRRVPALGEHSESLRKEFSQRAPVQGNRPVINSAASDYAVRTELLVPEPAEALAGLLGTDPPQRVLPPLWHWVYLLERPRQDELGDDGHPRHGVESPPRPGLQRMFAGGRVCVHRELRLGEVATRTTRVVSTRTKEGRSGPLTFVTTRGTIEQGGDLAIVDERDIVYRLVPPQSERANRRIPPTDTVLAGVTQTLSLKIDPVILFRFSALTYNAHRIHYDRDYAKSEGHPDLVVHGPLQAIFMAEALRRTRASWVGHEFGFRLVAPCWGGGRIVAIASAGMAQVRAGSNVVTATATLRPIG